MKTGGRQKKIQRRLHTAVCSIIICIFAVSFFLPILITFTNSFMTEEEIQWNYGSLLGNVSENQTMITDNQLHLKIVPECITLKQYKTILLDGPEYLYLFWNSVLMVVPIVILQVGIAVFAAYGFVRLQKRSGRLFLFLYMILMIMPYQVLVVPNYIVFYKMNLVNTICAILLSGIFAPYSTYILAKKMKRIPEELVEAAKIDGAGEWNVFSKIMLPLCRSTLVMVIILVFIDYWNMVEQPIALLNDASRQPLSVLLSRINREQIGISFAAGVVYMLYPLLLFLYGERDLESEISYVGGLKG